jgi:dihydrolipoamide dehydrogenase
VTLFEGLDRVLPTEDADISKVAARDFKKQGIKVHTKTFVENVKDEGDKVTFTFGDEQAEADFLIIAAGRGPDVEGLGLDVAGVQLDDRGLIGVDDTQKTSAGRSTPSATSCAAPRSRTRPPTRASSPRRRSRARRRTRSPTRHPARDVLRAERRLLRADGGAGQGGRLRRRGRQGALRRRRRRRGLRRPQRDDQDRRRAQVRRAARRPHRRLEVHRAHPGARERQALEGGYAEVARMVHGHPTISEAVMEAARAADGWLIHG